MGASPNAIAAAPDADRVGGGPDPGGGGLLARIDARTNQVGPTVPLPQPPTGLAVTRDGRTVWVATAADQAIHRIDTQRPAR